jgi:transposase
MTTSYLPYAPQQQMLLPHALQEWLPEGHLVYYISDSIDSLDLSAFHARYAGGGSRNQPFHPSMMVKVLVYGYATGVFSSRKLASKLHEDVAFRVLAAGNFPAHRTLSDFRALHLKVRSVPSGGQAGARMWPGQIGNDRCRWHQDQGQRIASQGHELRADAKGRA